MPYDQICLAIASRVPLLANGLEGKHSSNEIIVFKKFRTVMPLHIEFRPSCIVS